jgi:hypothetical protein
MQLLFRCAKSSVEAQGEYIKNFLLSSASRNSETMIQKSYAQTVFFSCIVMQIFLLLVWSSIFRSRCIRPESLLLQSSDKKIKLT